MKVLIADTFEQNGLRGLEAAGCDVIYQPELADAALAEAIAKTHAAVLVVRSTKVTESMLDAPQLSLIVRAGAGYNTIDVAAASKRGIYVSNCPGRNAIAVAELTMGLLLALDRRIPDNVAELRAGRWNKKEFSKAQGLFGRTLGLLGSGPIACEVARRAAAFGMSLLIWSRRFNGADRAMTAGEMGLLGLELQPRQPLVMLGPTPEAVAARADALSVHLALSKETRGLVGVSVFAQMKRGALFLNTSRGEIVDPSALDAAVRERGIRAGLDVFAVEPSAAVGAFTDTIVTHPGVYGTHHIGASTDQAQEAIAAETVRIVSTFRQTGRVPNVVNLSKRTPATHMLVVRHKDRPGVLAHVFEHLRAAHINVQETENVVFEGAQAAIARINVDGSPGADTLVTIRAGNPDILDLQIVPL